MKRLCPRHKNLIKFAFLLLCMAFWSSGSIHAASDDKVSKDLKFNAAKPAAKQTKQLPSGASRITTNNHTFPDLMIQSVFIDGGRPTTRDAFPLSVEVRNKGNAASRTCQLEIKVGGEGIGSMFTVPVLAPSSSHTLRRTVKLPVPQRYRSTIRVDVDNRNVETNEENNERFFDFTVHPAPLPDLTIHHIGISPDDPTTVDEVTLSVVVKNIGHENSRGCQLEIKAGGEGSSPRYMVPALPPNRTHTVRRTLALPVPQIYRSTATIDMDGRNAESDESNNDLSLDFTVGPEPRPDLTIQQMTVSPENPTTADEITLTVVVKNTGTEGSRMCQLEIRAGGEGSSPRYMVPVLSPNRTHTVRRTLALPVPQIYRSTATIDMDGRNAESDEHNNQDHFDFTVRPGE